MYAHKEGIPMSDTEGEASPGGATPLITQELVRSNNIEEVERILEEASETGEDISRIVNQPVGQWNQSPLHIAATEGFFDLVCLFLQHGADINKQDKNDWSPLHCAAKHSHLEITQVLLNQNADVTLLNESGTSAFHYLIRFKVHPKQRDLFLSVLSTMRSLGQDIDVQNQNGETPLHQAALEGCLIAIRWLLASGAEVDKKTCYGETPLHFACRVSQRETVLLLLEAGASLDIEGAYGTPLKVAENTTTIREAIEEFLAQKNSKYDYSSEEEGDEEEMNSSSEDLVNSISEDLRLEIAPSAAMLVHTPSSRTRRALQKMSLANGPAHLAPEQRRVRHIRAVHVRNVMAGDSLLNCFLTFHEYSTSSALEPRSPTSGRPSLSDCFFRSELAVQTLNPSWELALSSSLSFTGLPRFSLRVWSTPHGSDETAECILDIGVRLYRFGFLGTDLERVNIPISNLLILELTDGYYVKEDIATSHPLTPSVHTHARLAPIPASSLSYSRAQFQSMLKLHRKICSARTRNQALRDSLAQQLNTKQHNFDLNQRRELLKQSIEGLKERIKQERIRMAERKEEARQRRNHALAQSKRVSKALFDLLSTKQELQISIRRLNHSKGELSEFNFALEARQGTLIRELRTLFPISQTVDQHKSLSIHGIRLPNTDFGGCAEESIATALGFVCQVVFMLSRWLDVPLRYSMVPACSRSTISDPISTLSTANTFPLYSRGVDRTRFEYAVYLLNKNLEQLLNSQSLDIITLRHTLPNLQYLLVSRGKRSGVGRRTNRKYAETSSTTSSNVSS